ncbi:MAG: hypothetical protein QXX95_02680 [Nitrososphaerales archaeon]
MSVTSPVEKAITTLTKLEKDIDELKVYLEEKKRRLIALAKEEAKKVKNLALEEVRRVCDEELKLREKKAKEEKERILREAEEKTKKVKDKIDSVYIDMVRITIEELIG